MKEIKQATITQKVFYAFRSGNEVMVSDQKPLGTYVKSVSNNPYDAYLLWKELYGDDSRDV